MDIISSSPSNGELSLPLGTQITVTFDEEVDPDSLIDSGAFVVKTTTSKLVIEGPGMETFSAPPYNYLTSDLYSGIVPGTISTSDNLTFTFSPASLLDPNATIEILLGTRIRTKTLGEIVPGGGNAGTGQFLLKGPYIGDDDQFTITVRGSGALGAATFSYRRDSSGVESETIVTDRLIELDDGVFVLFRPGAYVLGDTYTFEVYSSTTLDNIYSFSFSTGSPTYTEVSEDRPSVQLINRTVEGDRHVNEVLSGEEEPLTLLRCTPSLEASNVPIGFNTIVLTFNKPIDPDSISNATIKVIQESLPMDEDESSYPLLVSVTANDNKLILKFRG